MKHRRRFVCALLNDGPVNELRERVVRVLIRVPLSARRFSVIQLLDGGVKPPGGHTRFCEQRERTQLASSGLLCFVRKVFECVLDGQA